MSSKGRPYRRVIVDGFEILIGRGAQENDALSFGVAAQTDSWLHVAGGTPGSHVVIRNPERIAIPRAVVERAASHAAWFSKAKNAAWVEVHYCQVADLRKPRGAPAGLVQLKRYQSVRVRPTAPEGPAEEPAEADEALPEPPRRQR
ncbi:MAG TPA: NFACT RNA binding domain-containing protein [Polyangiaceae bacterium]|nr:NFACT RNA binding domain-containing protein [Polyangiaceae bacterium]